MEGFRFVMEIGIDVRTWGKLTRSFLGIFFFAALIGRSGTDGKNKFGI